MTALSLHDLSYWGKAFTLSKPGFSLFFFFLLFLKSLFLMCISFPTNTPSVSDEVIKRVIIEKQSGDSALSPCSLAHRRGALGSPAGRKAAARSGDTGKKAVWPLTTPIPFCSTPRTCPFSDSALRKRTNETVILKGKLSANPVVKNQLEPLRRAVGQVLGFPHRVLSTQRLSV